MTTKTKIYIASFGGGTNSTAMIIDLLNSGGHLDLIIFADTGAEHPETYCHIEKFNHWLTKKGYSEIVRVQNKYKNGSVDKLEERCLQEKMLPSYAYGFKGCSKRYKLGPIEKFINNWEPAKKSIKNGNKVIRLIGFDVGEEHRVLTATKNDKLEPSKKYIFQYPLYEKGINRQDCIEIIKKEGLLLPGKSSCFFCPAMKKDEILTLKHKYPDLFQRAINLERNAKESLHTIKGLAGYWSWESFTSQNELFPELFPEPRASEICCDCYDG